MHTKDELIQQIIPEEDCFNTQVHADLQGRIYRFLVDGDKKNNCGLFSADDVKKIMKWYNITQNQILRKIDEIGDYEGTQVCKDNYSSTLSSICRENSTVSPGRMILLALMECIPEQNVPVAKLMKYIDFCTVVRILEKSDDTIYYTTEKGRKILEKSSVEEIERAIEMVREEEEQNSVFEEEYLYRVSDMNLRILYGIKDKIAKYPIVLWKIMKELAWCSEEKLDILQQYIEEEKITLRTIHIYYDWLVSLFSVEFNACPIEMKEREKMIREINRYLDQIEDGDFVNDVIWIFCNMQEKVWKTALMFFLYNNNFSSEKSEEKVDIKKVTKNIFERAKKADEKRIIKLLSSEE